MLVWRAPAGPSGQRASESLCAAVEGLRGGAKRTYTATVTILKAVQVHRHAIGGVAAISSDGILAWAMHSFGMSHCGYVYYAGFSKDTGGQ